MKDKIYPILIGFLVLTLGMSMYLLYSKNEMSLESTQKLQETKTVDIKELKLQKENNLMSYTPSKIDTKEVTQKLADLKQMLSITQGMLKEYNQNNANVIIKDNDIDKLVSLDFKHSNANKNISNTEDDTLETEQKENDITKEEDDISDSSKIASTNTNLNTYGTVSSTSKTSSSSSSTEITTTTSETTTTSSTTTDTQTQSQSEDVTTEVAKLQTQIDDVKKIISQVGAGIN